MRDIPWIQVQLRSFDGQRQQGQVVLHMAGAQGQTLDKTGSDGPSRQPRVQGVARPCHKGEKIRPMARRREKFVNLLHHQLGSPVGTGAEPFMDEGDRAW